MKIGLQQLGIIWGWIKVKFFCYLSVLFIISTNIIYAQFDSTFIITEDALNNILTEPDEESDNEEIVNLVEELLRNPIDLNTSDVFEISKLPKLDTQTAQKIIEHRNKFGYFFSPSELFSISQLDKELIVYILPFIKTTNPDIKSNGNGNEYDTPVFESFFRKSKFKLRSRITNDLQMRKGFESNKYVGSKIKSYNRLLFDFERKYQAGFLAEKDPGELSYSDFTSFHLQVKDFGFVKNFVAGDYVLEFGQGLALWSPFGFSKGSDAVFPVKKNSNNVRPYTSAAEYRFSRGAAAKISISDFSLTAFYSDISFDATVDSLTGEITSIGQTGLHRFTSELNKKDAAQSKLIGGVLEYKFANIINTGVIYYNTHTDKAFEPSSIYDLHGDNFNYVSAYYDFNLSKINLFGEACFDETSVASINGFQFSAHRNFIFTSAIRSYPRNYNNLYGFGFSERNGKINNEIGVYSGFKWRTAIGILNLYYDIFKFPYRTTENSLSSEGNELLFDLVTAPYPKFELRLRYKYEDKEVTELINIESEIVRRLKQSIRAEFSYDFSRNLRSKSRAEYNHFLIKDAGVKEAGFLIFQEIKFVPGKNISLNGRIIFFQTDSFNSAVYEYENDLFGVMPNLAMYGKGVRWYLIVKYRPLPLINLSAKYSETYKPEEISLSSGDNEINGNVDNRFSLQIDVSF